MNRIKIRRISNIISLAFVLRENTDYDDESEFLDDETKDFSDISSIAIGMTPPTPLHKMNMAAILTIIFVTRLCVACRQKKLLFLIIN